MILESESNFTKKKKKIATKVKSDKGAILRGASAIQCKQKLFKCQNANELLQKCLLIRTALAHVSLRGQGQMPCL